jgi:hypothetical protein
MWFHESARSPARGRPRNGWLRGPDDPDRDDPGRLAVTRPPCVGDILLHPQRMVEWVDFRARVFRAREFGGTPLEHHGAENLPVRMRDMPWQQAPIEDGWVELPSRGRVPHTLAVPLIVAIYEMPDGGAGHCLEQPDICDRCRQCAAVLAQMSVTARKKAVRRASAVLWERARARATRTL